MKTDELWKISLLRFSFVSIVLSALSGQILYVVIRCFMWINVMCKF